MTHGSLFSGIGGFDLAADWMGWQNIFHCEINPFGRQVLNHYWPNAISYEDITKTNFSIHRGQIDILSGGFPCQPFSLAGQRKGAEDDRYLWPEMLRAINEVRPRWVVGENVAGIVSMVQPESVELNLESQADIFGEINQITLSEQQQYVVETVCQDLERIGYSVQPLIIPACGIGAPHKRDRIWFIAQNTNDDGRRGFVREKESKTGGFRNSSTGNNERIQADDGKVRPTTNTTSKGLEIARQTRFRQHEKKIGEGMANRFEQLCHTSANTESSNEQRNRLCKICSQKEIRRCNCKHAITNPECRGRLQILHDTESGFSNGISIDSTHELPDWSNFPTQPPVCGGDDGLPSQLDGITFPKWRSESIKAYGNAVVPLEVLEIFKSIEYAEKQLNKPNKQIKIFEEP